MQFIHLNVLVAHTAYSRLADLSTKIGFKWPGRLAYAIVNAKPCYLSRGFLVIVAILAPLSLSGFRGYDGLYCIICRLKIYETRALHIFNFHFNFVSNSGKMM